MTTQKSIILLVIAILAMALVTLSQREDATPVEDLQLLPGFSEAIDSLEKLEIRTTTETISIVPAEQGGWVVEEKGNYPVDFSTFRMLVDALSTAELLEKKTSRPENHARLGVAGVEDPGSKQVTAIAAGKTFSIFIGLVSEGPGGNFVRLAGEDQVWLTDAELEVADAATAWLDPVIINVEEKDISAVRQLDGSGATLVEAGRSDAGELVLGNLPADRELRYGSVTDDLARALQNVRLRDVMPHSAERWSDSRRAVYTLANDDEIEVLAHQDNDGRFWLHLTGTAAWDYEVAEYVYDDFTRELDEFLKELETPEVSEKDLVNEETE